MSTLVAESCTTSLRTARWTVGLGDAAEDQDQFVNLFPALLDDPEVVNNDWTAVMQVHSDCYNVRTLPYTDENTWCFPVVLPQVAWGDLMNYVRTNSWAYQLPYVPTDVGWRVLLATCRLLIHLRQARGSSRVGGLLPDMQVDRSSPVVHQ